METIKIQFVSFLQFKQKELKSARANVWLYLFFSNYGMLTKKVYHFVAGYPKLFFPEKNSPRINVSQGHEYMKQPNT